MTRAPRRIDARPRLPRPMSVPALGAALALLLGSSCASSSRGPQAEAGQSASSAPNASCNAQPAPSFARFLGQVRAALELCDTEADLLSTLQPLARHHGFDRPHRWRSNKGSFKAVVPTLRLESACATIVWPTDADELSLTFQYDPTRDTSLFESVHHERIPRGRFAVVLDEDGMRDHALPEDETREQLVVLVGLAHDRLAAFDWPARRFDLTTDDERMP